MSISKMVIRQRDFSVGVIDPDAERRDDMPMFKASVRDADNLQFLSTGGLERRSGRRLLYSDEGVRDDFRLVSDITHNITFAHRRATVRNAAGTVIATLTAPWVAANIDHLSWVSNDNMVIVCGPSMRPQVIEVDKTALTWTIRNYDFYIGPDGQVYAPFYRFAGRGITMKPSALSGSITMTTSAPFWQPGHVGVLFRYVGRQFRVTGITSSTVATAEVIQKFRPTMRWTSSDDVAGFTIGEAVSTRDTGIEGEIIELDIPNKRVTIVVTNRYRWRDEQDRLIGPNSDVALPSVTEGNFIEPGPSIQWDEQFMSDFRGWPRSVAKDSQRIIFSDFDQLKPAIAWTALNDPFDLMITADATGAILEMIEADCRVYHVVGGYDQFAITDIGVFYIPISADNPLKPGSVEFRRVYSGEVSEVKPIQVTEGVLFVDSTRTGIYSISATGQTARPYVANELTQFHRSLFSEIKGIAASSGTPKAPTRQIFAINGDGSVVIGQYNVEGQYVGWLPWSGQGSVRSISAKLDDVVISSQYAGANGPLYVAEQVDPDMLFDSMVKVGTINLTFLAGTTVQVFADGFPAGSTVVGPAGQITGFEAFSELWIGFGFDWHVTPNLQDFEGGEAFGQRMRRRKVSRVMIKVRDTQEFQIGNRLLAGYVGGDDTGLPMPLRSDVFQYRELGRSFDPQFTIRQSVPGKFKLLELTTEVTI
ncbi:hypothetical protein ACTOV4_00635 [Brucella sp. C7-11G]